MCGFHFIVASLQAVLDFVTPVRRVLQSVLPYAVLGATCFVADLLIFVYRDDVLPRVLIDNLSHGIIAAISWLVVSGIERRRDVLEAVVCGLMASSLDVDHFVMAGSLSLSDALHLPRRPFLHTSSIVLAVAPLLQVCFAQNNPSLKSLPFIFTVAVLSHHLRDSHRRGLWFWPFGTTPPLPQWLYISCTLVLPYLVGMAIQLIDNMPIKTPEKPFKPIIQI